MRHTYRFALTAFLIALPTGVTSQPAATAPPFGSLRDQAYTQQRWLASRMTTVLPAIMRKYAVDMWVIPMREYNEDPVFTSIVSPTTFAARRRTIYVFSMRGDSVERIALGGSSQGGVYTAVRSTQAASGRTERNAELWGDEQWQALKRVIEERNPGTITVNVSRVFAFSDGLSAGEMEGMREALGEKWTSRFVRHDGLALDLIATRPPSIKGCRNWLRPAFRQVVRKCRCGEYRRRECPALFRNALSGRALRTRSTLTLRQGIASLTGVIHGSGATPLTISHGPTGHRKGGA